MPSNPRPAASLFAASMAIILCAAVALTSCGYDGPKMNVAELHATLKSDPDKLLVVDVRPKVQFDRGHVARAVSVPLEEIDRHLEKLKKRGKPLAVICTCGRRALPAVKTLQANGFQASLVVGGMLEWEKAGYPVVKRPDLPAR